MRSWVIRWALNVAAIGITAYLLPGFEVTFMGALIGSVFLGVVNAVIRPILLIFTLPLNILTLGLFTFVVNALMLWLTSEAIDGFIIDDFWWALLTAIVMSLVSMVISALVKK